MADLSETDHAAHRLDHIMRGFSSRLVDNQDSVEGKGLWSSGHEIDFASPRRMLAGIFGAPSSVPPRRAALRFFRVTHFAEQVVDALPVFLRLVEQKQNLRRAPQVDSLDQFVAYIP